MTNDERRQILIDFEDRVIRPNYKALKYYRRAGVSTFTAISRVRGRSRFKQFIISILLRLKFGDEKVPVIYQSLDELVDDLQLLGGESDTLQLTKTAVLLAHSDEAASYYVKQRRKHLAALLSDKYSGQRQLKKLSWGNDLLFLVLLRMLG